MRRLQFSASNRSLFFIVNLGILALIVIAIWPIIDLVFSENLVPDQLLESELAPVKQTNFTVIPKIIHQTYKTDKVPERWNETHVSVMQKNPDYTYMFWTDEKARRFISDEYSWFLNTYDNYPYPIMRADALRYFILSHYGGVYIDLDNGCDFSLDPLLQFPAWLRQTDPIGVSNDIMGSVPGHPFFLKVVRSLQKFDKAWGIPYLRVMYSTGPLFLSVVRHRYVKAFGPRGPRPGAEIRILVPVDHELHTRWFFFESDGSSWHSWDALTITFINDHAILASLVIVSMIITVFYWEYKLIAKLRSLRILRKARTIFSRYTVSSAVSKTKRYVECCDEKFNTKVYFLPINSSSSSSEESDDEKIIEHV